MRFSPVLVGLIVAGLGSRSNQAVAQDAAQAQPTTASRITVIAGLGYAYPLGSAERGTRARDVSFGIVPITAGGSHDFAPNWSTRARVHYAPNIPTLCATGPDCTSSIGRDIALTVGIGRVLPAWRRATPQLSFEIGWEWLTTKLSDAGVSSARSWSGPVAALELFVDLRSRGAWSLGPAIGIDAGVFSRADLETPAWHTSGSANTSLHAWPSISFHIGRRL